MYAIQQQKSDLEEQLSALEKEKAEKLADSSKAVQVRMPLILELLLTVTHWFTVSLTRS